MSAHIDSDARWKTAWYPAKASQRIGRYLPSCRVIAGSAIIHSYQMLGNRFPTGSRREGQVECPGPRERKSWHRQIQTRVRISLIGIPGTALNEIVRAAIVLHRFCKYACHPVDRNVCFGSTSWRMAWMRHFLAAVRGICAVPTSMWNQYAQGFSPGHEILRFRKLRRSKAIFLAE
jgi:hypothetical protein